jgi:O-antigen/teichoic acid export membrane protein
MNSGGVARSQVLLLGGQLIRLTLSVVLTAFLGRSLSLSGFGYFGLVSSIFLIAQEVLEMGTTAVVLREVAQTPASEAKLLGTLLSWRRMVAVVLAVGCCALALSHSEMDESERLVLVFASLGIALLFFNAYNVVFPLRQSFGRVLVLGLSIQTSFLFLVLLLPGRLLSGAVIGLLVVIREIVQIIGIRFLGIQLLGYRATARWTDTRLLELLKTSWTFGLTVVLYKLAFFGGNLFVWILADPDTMGRFSAAFRPVAPLLDLSTLFVTPLIAAMSWSVRGDAPAFARQFNAYFKLFVATTLLIAIGGCMIAPLILNLLYGDRYLEAGDEVVKSFRWLSVGLGFGMLSQIFVVADLAKKRERELLAASLICFGLSMLACAVSVPRFGAQGAAFATCIGQVVALSYLAVLSVSRGEVRLGKSVLLYVTPPLILGGILALLTEFPMARLILAFSGAGGILVFLWSLPEQRQCRDSFSGAGYPHHSFEQGRVRGEQSS